VKGAKQPELFMIQINNPGNIRPGNKFQGEEGEEKGFSVFNSRTNGIRAYFKNLHTAIFVHNRHTICDYITAYAPPSENDTEGYISQMCNRTGISEDMEIPTNEEFLCKFALAQFEIENGKNDITEEECLEGLRAANLNWE
jgi:hypothetical protein